jgi:light-regulated signal transduction histidine kinase (bacteriophytochrome)
VNGEITGVVMSFRDVSERRQAEEKERRARREIEAKSTEIARLNAELEQRVRLRTAELETSNRELEAFSYSVSHDLRAPLRSIDGFSHILLEEHGDKLDADARHCLSRVRAASQHMGQLIDALLQLSRVTRADMQREAVDLSAMAQVIVDGLKQATPARQIDVRVAPGLHASGDPRLLQVALQNLLGNAFKFSSKREHAEIEFGSLQQDGATVFFLRDNGAGFQMEYSNKLFGAFQRLHGVNEFEGTGIGLATVQRIVRRHGGRIWGEGEPDRGATFYFTLS